MSSLHHNHQNNEVLTDLKHARDYLGVLEAIAHHGRVSNDPVEVAATLPAFAEPSHVLKRLAKNSRRCAT